MLNAGPRFEQVNEPVPIDMLTIMYGHMHTETTANSQLGLDEK